MSKLRQDSTNIHNNNYKDQNTFDERLYNLEKQVTDLKNTIQKERTLFRKAILMQLDIDQVYDGF